MSTLEMTSLCIGIATPCVFMIATWLTFRGSAASERAAKVFLKRDSWPGELHNTRIESWQQSNILYGGNLFFDISFYLGHSQQLYSAKALITLGQVHLLRKGLPLVVKTGKRGRIAVMQIGAWQAENT